MYYYRLVFIGAILPFIVTITVNAATHQRFSNLNRLLNHLDGSTELPPTSTVPTTSAPHRIRHTHWQQHFDNSFQQQFDSLNSNNNNNNGNINNNKELVPFDEDEDEEDETLEDPQPQEEQLQSDIRHRLPFTTSVSVYIQIILFIPILADYWIISARSSNVFSWFCLLPTQRFLLINLPLVVDILRDRL